MLSKKQADNKDIQDIINYYAQEKQYREYEELDSEVKVRIGDFRLDDNFRLQICNGFISGEPRWADVPYD